MKILLVGYGKMGKAIEAIAAARGHQIVGKVDVDSPADSIKPGADVAIEFTQPSSAYANVRRCIDNQIPVVCGTTGWTEKLDEIRKYCTEKNGAFFYASNYSLGVNIFFRLNEQLAKMMSNQSGYSVKVEETHHTQKKDAPSGTAITLAEGILHNINSKKKWVNEKPASDNELFIESFRVDPAPGTHVIRYSSEVDDIEISHTAHSRQGFAFGAVAVAEWIVGRKGNLTMNDFLKL